MQSEGSEEECFICLEEFRPDAVVDFTPCAHKFHYECLNTLKNSIHYNGLCPMCRTPLHVAAPRQAPRPDPNLQEHPANAVNHDHLQPLHLNLFEDDLGIQMPWQAVESRGQPLDQHLYSKRNIQAQHYSAYVPRRPRPAPQIQDRHESSPASCRIM